MDKYKEQLVAKGKDSSDTTKRILVMAGGIILATFAIFISIRIFGMAMILMGIVLAALVLWGAYYIIGGMYIEYEYIFTNGELDVDKIMGQRKRKRLITIDLKSVYRMGLHDGTAPEQLSVVDASNRESDSKSFIDFKHSELGNTRLVFSPNEELSELIDSAISRSVSRG